MGLKTKIEYCTATHNFWYGCDKISEGCKNCFAERIYKRFYKNFGGTSPDFSKIIKAKNFDAPLKWKKPQIILVNDMSDFFHKDVPVEWQSQALHLMNTCNNHIFLLLTKRPKNMAKFFSYRDVSKINNIWLGVSVENQKTADERIPELLKIPHFKKWISFEPLLGEIDGTKLIKWLPKIDFAVVGGETGRGARHMNPNWAYNLMRRCQYASVPFFMKQMSNKAPIPKDLMVREYPNELREQAK